MSASSREQVDHEALAKQPLPKDGSFIIASSYVDRYKNKECKDVYKVKTDDDKSFTLTPITSLKNSYWVSSNVFPFVTDKKWFAERDIQVITADQTRELMDREQNLIHLLKEIGDKFQKTNMFKFDIDKIGSSRPLGTTETLHIAKLNTPVIISFGENRRAKVTHISDIGELITKTTGGLHGISYTELSSRDLEKASSKFLEVGFTDKIEPALTNTRKVGKRYQEAESGLSMS